jgi:hypothetical protein
MNDPRILNDPDMIGALEPIKRIHAIRLMSQDERAGMSPEEEIEYLNKRAEALDPVKEIHAARLMIQDETAGMTSEEKAAYHKKNVAALFSGTGLSLPEYVNLSGQGRLKPRQPLTQ